MTEIKKYNYELLDYILENTKDISISILGYFIVPNTESIGMKQWDLYKIKDDNHEWVSGLNSSELADFITAIIFSDKILKEWK
jgi:hypothetical protein